jgi:hypothetical protein
MSRSSAHEVEGSTPATAGERARGRSRRSGKETEAAAPHLVRSTSWAGLRAGEAVRVDGVRQRSASWTFVAHVVNTRNGDEWVEVAGGRPGNHALRSFRPEQIFPAAPGRGGKTRKGARPFVEPSLAEAPRLPL